ncbi:MAG: HD domain-containing phosphohydrolase, partial [Myxococcota bacterium]
MTIKVHQRRSTKVQLLGRTLVLQLHMVIRTLRIHDPTNRALLIATENLKDTINTLWAALDKTVRVQFVEGVVYLNDVRIRMDLSTQGQVQTLQDEFVQRGLGGLAFARPVDSAALKDFLLRFSRPVNSDDDRKVLRAELESFRNFALELLEPAYFTAGFQEEEQLRVDKKTFALQTYAKSIVAVREFIRSVQKSEPSPDDRLQVTRIVQDMVDIATERVNFLLKLAAIKTADEYAYNHAANTCVLAIVLGRALNVDRLQLVDLGLSALFADIGFALLPSEVLDTPTTLSESERAILRDSMVRQIRAIVGRGQITEGLMRRVIVAFEHHVPYFNAEADRPNELHLFSRIVAVADTFDALTTRRPWREGYTADEAIRLIMEDAGSKFDPLVVKVLVNLLGLYPLGCAVRLVSGETAVVYHNSNDPRLFDRPWVKVLLDEHGQRVKRTIVRNLANGDG